MRKLGLLTAAAGLAVSGSVAKADFVINHSRQTAAFTLNSVPMDIVTFTVTNTGTNSTGTTLQSVVGALYTPDAGGMIIGVGDGSKTGIPVTQADVFGTNGTTFPHTSWIADNTSPFSLSGNTGGAVLLLGGNPSSNPGVDPASQTFTANQAVQGIAGTIFTTGAPQTNTSPIIFAQAVVPTGETVELFNPVAANNRAFEHNSGNFSPDGNTTVASSTFTSQAIPGPIIDAVPEPTSLALFGIGAAGLLARRRRTA